MDLLTILFINQSINEGIICVIIISKRTKKFIYIKLYKGNKIEIIVTRYTFP